MIQNIINRLQKNKLNKTYLNTIVYILFCISLILYIISLKGCFLPFNECALHTKIAGYFILGVLLIISCFLFALLISIQIISRLKCINYLIFFTIYLIIFCLTQGTDFAHHGTYNSIIFLLFFPFFLFISFIIYLTLYFCFKLEIKKLLFLSLIYIYIIIFFYTNTKCNNFYDGIGQIRLINDKKLNKCFIKKPRICGYNLLSGLFDVNYIFRKNGCEGYNDEKNVFLKYLDNELQIYNNFSFPRTEYWNPITSYKFLADEVEKKIKPSNEINSEDNEIFVSFQKNKGKISIQLKKNISLIEQKRKLAEKYPVKFNNVYLIYFDAISRNHFIRKLKKTTKIIEKMLYTNRKKEKFYKNYHAFQFFKYHSFDGHTEGNIFPLFYGNQRNSNQGITFLKFYNERGFITAATHNSCNKEIFDWPEKNEMITFSNFDHENIAMFCDTNYENKKNKWSILGGKSSILRRCFYGKDSFEYHFEYILQFLENYKKERKLFRISIEDGHEGTAEVIKYIDNSFASFLLKILKNYFDDKTALIIFSDHGAHMPGPYDALFYEEKIIEKYLGLLLLILPNIVNFDYSNILFNQQQFLTAYDIHDTLLDMININKTQYENMEKNKGESLFLKVNGKNRSCRNYPEEISDNFCFCRNFVI